MPCLGVCGVDTKMKSKKHTRHAGNRAPRPAGSPWQAFLRQSFAAGLGSWPLCNPLPHGALTERSHSFCPVPGPLPSLRLPAPQAGSRSAHAPAKAPAKARETAQKQNRNGAETFPKQFSLFRNIRRPRAASGRSSGSSSALVLPVVLAGAAHGLRPSWRFQGAVPARGRSAELALGQGRGSTLFQGGGVRRGCIAS